jgi:hypothetical protein
MERWADASVRLVNDDTKTRVRARCQNRRRSISGSVIDYDYLEISERLRETALDAACDGAGAVVRWNDYAEERPWPR